MVASKRASSPPSGAGAAGAETPGAHAAARSATADAAARRRAVRWLERMETMVRGRGCTERRIRCMDGPGAGHPQGWRSRQYCRYTHELSCTMKPFHSRAGALALCAVLAACSDGPTGSAGPPAAVAILAGDVQTAAVAAQLDGPLRVRVTDADGRAV